METNTGRTAPSLETHFFHRPFEFDFYQAIKILEALKPNCGRFGVEDDPLKEALHIRSRVSFSPASSDIYSIRSSAYSHKPPTLTVNFFGLAGVQGPLPPPFAEMIIDQERAKNTAFRDFLDIFNHRLLSAWYRIRLKMTPGLSQKPLIHTPMGKIFYDLCGLGTKTFQKKLTIADEKIILLAPLLWERPRSLAGLKQILKAYFHSFHSPSLALTLEPFVGKWVSSPLSELSTLGKTGQFNQLGRTLFLGKKIWIQNDGVKICFSNLSLKDYEKFLPHGPHFNHLTELIYLYGGVEMRPFLSLSIQKEEIPPARLGKMILGHTAWLGKGGGYGVKKSQTFHFPVLLKSQQIYHTSVHN